MQLKQLSSTDDALLEEDRTSRSNNPSSEPLLSEDDILYTPKSSPASQNRYIYYPDHLVRIPTPQKDVNLLYQLLTALQTLLTEPLFKTVPWSLIAERNKPDLQDSPPDESVYDYIARRFSPEIANNLVSSIYHGIFAGNIDRLSADTLMHQFWNKGSIVRSIFDKSDVWHTFSDLMMQEAIITNGTRARAKHLRIMGRDSATVTLKNGVGQLVDALCRHLEKSAKVEILTNADVATIDQVTESQLMVCCSSECNCRPGHAFITDYFGRSHAEPQRIRNVAMLASTTGSLPPFLLRN